MKKYRSPFYFTRRERRGIVVLVLFLILALAAYYYYLTRPPEQLQLVDTSKYQAKIDSLKREQQRKQDTIYPFNPNYLKDYRGYKLGLKAEELDRLYRFRESGKFINTPQQFKDVTQVSQQWLDSISPYFKFPEWVNKPRKTYKNRSWTDRPVTKTDINKAVQRRCVKYME